MNKAVDALVTKSEKAKLRVDVIATSFQNSALLEPQTHNAASWLSIRCGATLENIHDQVLVDSVQEGQIIRELRAAGFQVVRQRI